MKLNLLTSLIDKIKDNINNKDIISNIIIEFEKELLHERKKIKENYKKYAKTDKGVLKRNNLQTKYYNNNKEKIKMRRDIKNSKLTDEEKKEILRKKRIYRKKNKLSINEKRRKKYNEKKLKL
tara:strand:+ start:47 stop:415 length:369 start_codon:yes stop_codon:yes gene_type:complete